MGSLTAYLQREFARQCPYGWAARREVPLISLELADLLGYAPRADVLLERQDGTRRLWIEFEVSRADPVANHAKFATAHLFQPQAAGDTFVAMVSPHVARGRRNLAANAVSLMRQVGMSAFQTVLFPHLTAADVQRLNHAGLTANDVHLPAVQPELDRVLTVAEPVLTAGTRRVHLAGDLLDVLLNVRQWNEEQETPDGRALWGRRTVTYFVFDRHAGWFAPAKFCAYLPIPAQPQAITGLAERAVMTTQLYASLDGTDTRFDGHRAQTHLTRALAMHILAGPDVPPPFDTWLKRHVDAIQLHPTGPRILLPPPWFR